MAPFPKAQVGKLETNLADGLGNAFERFSDLEWLGVPSRHILELEAQLIQSGVAELRLGVFLGDVKQLV